MSKYEFIEDVSHQSYNVDPDSTVTPIVEIYQKSRGRFWIETVIDSSLSIDERNFDDLPNDIKNLMEHVIGFFLYGDGWINEVIQSFISSRITVMSIKIWYNWQMMMEDIHNKTYTKIMNAYFKDKKIRTKLLNLVKGSNVIQQKIEWAKKWLKVDNETFKLTNEMRSNIKNSLTRFHKIQEMFGETNTKTEELITLLGDNQPPLSQQLFINVIFEGLFFTASFAFIIWVCDTYKNALPGLYKANEEISIDEGEHTDVGIILYNSCSHRLSENHAIEIMKEAVGIEYEFVKMALPNDLVGMNKNLMLQYLKFVADQLMHDMKYGKIWNVQNPFPFMNKFSIGNRAVDFFVGQGTEYQNGKATAIKIGNKKRKTIKDL